MALYIGVDFLWHGARFLFGGFTLTLRRTPPCLAHATRPFPGEALPDDQGAPELRGLRRERKGKRLSR
jgi:hypothetical protein